MTPLTLACSGPGAARAIQDNILYAQQHAIAVAALAVLSITLWFVIRRFTGLPLIVLLLLLAHPAWTISARSGDCGDFKADAATAVTITCAVCIALQALTWLWPVLSRSAKTSASL